MAINLHSRYDKQVQQAFRKQSIMEGRLSDNYSFVGVETVKVSTLGSVTLNGHEYLVFDGTDIKPVTEIAYRPTTVIARGPTGGGTTYERVSLLTPWRSNYFKGDGSSKIYQLDAVELDADTVTVKIGDTEKTEGSDFAVNRETGQLTFTVAPPKPAVDGQDNVFVTFAKTVEGYGGRINGCTICTGYGVGTSDRVFFSGNPEFQNWDWYCALNDPSYIEDLSYSNVGTEDTAIMGYRRLGEYLAIIKEDNGQDSTIFLRGAGYSDDRALFPLKQGVAGIGAISKYAFGNLLDEPLFLHGTGIYAITSNIITAERTVQRRSHFINARLTREAELKNAVATEWKGYYILATGGRCYLLDGTQPRAKVSENEYTNECYFWEGVPAVRFMNFKHEDREVLYFGTADGKICRFNDDIATMSRYGDYPDGLEAPGVAIAAAWATKMDDDGHPSTLKTMQKRGCAVTLKPYTRSSAVISLRSDRDLGDQPFAAGTMDIFGWEDLDFARITFSAADGPGTIYLNRRYKKYKYLQIVVKNDAVGEGFGVYSIVKFYRVGSFAKR